MKCLMESTYVPRSLIVSLNYFSAQTNLTTSGCRSPSPSPSSRFHFPSLSSSSALERPLSLSRVPSCGNPILNLGPLRRRTPCYLLQDSVLEELGLVNLPLIQPTFRQGFQLYSLATICSVGAPTVLEATAATGHHLSNSACSTFPSGTLSEIKLRPYRTSV